MQWTFATMRCYIENVQRQVCTHGTNVSASKTWVYFSCCCCCSSLHVNQSSLIAFNTKKVERIYLLIAFTPFINAWFGIIIIAFIICLHSTMEHIFYYIEVLAEEFEINFIGRQSVDEFSFSVFLFCYSWIRFKINFGQRNQPDGYEYALHWLSSTQISYDFCCCRCRFW